MLKSHGKLLLSLLLFCFVFAVPSITLASEDTVTISKQDLQTFKNNLQSLKNNNNYLRNALNESNPALAKVSEQLAQSEQKLAASEKRCQELEALLTEYDKEAKSAISESKKMTTQLQTANQSLAELKKQTDSKIKRLEIERNIGLIGLLYLGLRK